ncbi:MAG: GldG family protein, partial [Chthoniobacteraceae bacterium]
MQNKSLQTFLYSAGGVAAMAAILVAVNILVGAARTRVDLTKEKAYTLSDGTKAILNKLDTPVTIRFFFSKSAESSPQAVFFKGYAAKVEDLLAEYKLASKGKIILEKIDPKPDSDDEDKARLNGVEGMPFPNGEKF